MAETNSSSPVDTKTSGSSSIATVVGGLNFKKVGLAAMYTGLGAGVGMGIAHLMKKNIYIGASIGGTVALAASLFFMTMKKPAPAPPPPPATPEPARRPNAITDLTRGGSAETVNSGATTSLAEVLRQRQASTSEGA